MGAFVAATGILIDADRDVVTVLGAAVWVLACVLLLAWLTRRVTRPRFLYAGYGVAILVAANLWDVPSDGVSGDEVRREATWLGVVVAISVVVVLRERRKQSRQRPSGGTA